MKLKIVKSFSFKNYTSDGIRCKQYVYELSNGIISINQRMIVDKKNYWAKYTILRELPNNKIFIENEILIKKETMMFILMNLQNDFK